MVWYFIKLGIVVPEAHHYIDQLGKGHIYPVGAVQGIVLEPRSIESVSKQGMQPMGLTSAPHLGIDEGTTKERSFISSKSSKPWDAALLMDEAVPGISTSWSHVKGIPDDCCDVFEKLTGEPPPTRRSRYLSEEGKVEYRENRRHGACQRCKGTKSKVGATLL